MGKLPGWVKTWIHAGVKCAFVLDIRTLSYFWWFDSVLWIFWVPFVFRWERVSLGAWRLRRHLGFLKGLLRKVAKFAHLLGLDFVNLPLFGVAGGNRVLVRVFLLQLGGLWIEVDDVGLTRLLVVGFVALRREVVVLCARTICHLLSWRRVESISHVPTYSLRADHWLGFLLLILHMEGYLLLRRLTQHVVRRWLVERLELILFATVVFLLLF